MNYEGALNKVCLKKHNHYWIMNHRRSNQEIIDIMTEAAELYARSKWDQACEEQMKEVYSHIGPDGNTNRNAINHWTKTPKFKP